MRMLKYSRENTHTHVEGNMSDGWDLVIGNKIHLTLACFVILDIDIWSLIVLLYERREVHQTITNSSVYILTIERKRRSLSIVETERSVLFVVFIDPIENIEKKTIYSPRKTRIVLLTNVPIEGNMTFKWTIQFLRWKWSKCVCVNDQLPNGTWIWSNGAFK